MKRMVLIAVVLSVGMSLAGWRGRFDEQFAAASSRWTPAKLNPIAWYKGDGNALDAMGNYDGTWAGTEAYADGLTGSSFYNASTNCIVIPHATAFNSTDRSISVWVNYSSTSGDRCIITKGSASGFHLRLRTGTVDYSWNQNYNVLSTTLANNAWQHVVVVQSGTTATIYIDGVAVKTGFSGSLPVTTSNYPIYIFARLVSVTTGKMSEHFAGQIDDVLIFDRALTAEEIKKLYDESVKRNGRAW
jgi:hypothetical protein